MKFINETAILFLVGYCILFLLISAASFAVPVKDPEPKKDEKTVIVIKPMKEKSTNCGDGWTIKSIKVDGKPVKVECKETK